MTDSERLQELLTCQLSEERRRACLNTIQRELLVRSRFIAERNFSRIDPQDLQVLFELYDSLFLSGLCRKVLARTPLNFRISSRMTSAGGTTRRYRHHARPERNYYEIAVSAPLLLQSFQDVERPIVVTGLPCHDRLEALQRVFEHELVHLIELLIWDGSKCSQPRFQQIASYLFGHTDHRHQLVTKQEQAWKRHGIRKGMQVRFRYQTAELVGVVNRITKRATVLVLDPNGERYSDGKCYVRYYVPIQELEPLQ